MSYAVVVACGSFNPITYGHLRMLEIAKDILISKGYSDVEGILSPVSDAYKKEGLLPSRHRIKMCQLAVRNSDWIRCDSWEGTRTTFTPTVKVLRYFKELYEGDVSVFFVAGSDLVNSFKNPCWWSLNEVKEITSSFTTIMVERIGQDMELDVHHKVIKEILPNIVRCPGAICYDISSTKVRKCIAMGRSIRYLTDDNVVDYISQEKLYKVL